jgi:hypothetical protein
LLGVSFTRSFRSSCVVSCGIITIAVISALSPMQEYKVVGARKKD